jgi:hypothetical protein
MASPQFLFGLSNKILIIWKGFHLKTLKQFPETRHIGICGSVIQKYLNKPWKKRNREENYLVGLNEDLSQ